MLSTEGSLSVHNDREPDALLQRVRQKMIDDLEAGLIRIPVDAGDIGEKVESSSLHRLAGGDNFFSSNGQGQFPAIKLCVLDGARQLPGKRRDGRMIGMG